MMRHMSVCSLIAVLGLILSNATAQAADPSGNWKWTINAGGNEFEIKSELKAEGEKLTGTVSRDDKSSPIMDGKVAGNEVSFSVVRERDGQKLLSKYKGKLDGDKITGTITVELGEQSFDIDWAAERIKK